MKLALLLAARDEEARVGRCLESLREFREAGDSLIACDDGSRDATAAIAKGFGGVLVEELPPSGRGLAYARCVELAPPDAEAFLMVQADMAFEPGSREAVLRALDEGGPLAWGFFRQKVERPGLLLRAAVAGNEFRAKRWGIPYGDQAMFFRREALERAGGFPEQARLEDLELSLRLRGACGLPILAEGASVHVSKRHWERRGVALQTAANWLETLRYRLARRRQASARNGRNP